VKVLILGASGFVGKHVVKKMLGMTEKNSEISFFQTSKSLGTDLRFRGQVHDLFRSTHPTHIINCSAFVGGIQYGYKYPAKLFQYNMEMIINIYEACEYFGVKRIIQPIANCAYPSKETRFKEENFWDGPMHESVRVYGLTRKSMVMASWAYRKQYGIDTTSLILSNMYGPGDHYEEERSHALGALIKKIIDAKHNGSKEVIVWGTGTPIREWLYVEDGAEALVRALAIEDYEDIINISSNQNISIYDLVSILKDEIKWDGSFVFDNNKPDGAYKKTIDGTLGKKLLNWNPNTKLREGIRKTIKDYENGNYRQKQSSTC
jgi:GDP-L-fucose synthase